MRTAQWKTWGDPPAGVSMSLWQNGRCAWCGHNVSALVRDHCHSTGLIRGLLCHACNQGESLSHSPDWEGWRSGDNVSVALGQFEIYQNHLGETPIGPMVALSFYTHAEQEAWFAAIVAELATGAKWPAEAPWTEAATSRRDDMWGRARVALDQGGRWSA